MEVLRTKFFALSVAVVTCLCALWSHSANANDEFLYFLEGEGFSLNLEGELDFHQVKEAYPEIIRDASGYVISSITDALYEAIMETVEDLNEVEHIDHTDEPLQIYVDQYTDTSIILEEHVHRLSKLNPEGTDVLSAVDQYINERNRIVYEYAVPEKSMERVEMFEGLEEQQFFAALQGKKDALKAVKDLAREVNLRLKGRVLIPTTILLGSSLVDDSLYLVLGFQGNGYRLTKLVEGYRSDVEEEWHREALKLSNGSYLGILPSGATVVGSKEVVSRLSQLDLVDAPLELTADENEFVRTHGVALLRFMKRKEISTLSQLFSLLRLVAWEDGDKEIPALISHTMPVRVFFFPTPETVTIPWYEYVDPKKAYYFKDGTSLTPGRVYSNPIDFVLTSPGVMPWEFGFDRLGDKQYEKWKKEVSDSLPLQSLLVELFGLPFVLAGDFNLSSIQKKVLLQGLKHPEHGLLSFKSLSDEEKDLLEQLPLDVLKEVKKFASRKLRWMKVKRIVREIGLMLYLGQNHYIDEIDGNEQFDKNIKSSNDQLLTMKKIRQSCQDALI